MRVHSHDNTIMFLSLPHHPSRRHPPAWFSQPRSFLQPSSSSAVVLTIGVGFHHPPRHHDRPCLRPALTTVSLDLDLTPPAASSCPSRRRRSDHTFRNPFSCRRPRPVLFSLLSNVSLC